MSEPKSSEMDSDKARSVIASPPIRPLSPIELLLAGCISGGFSKCITAPLDRVKILYQVQPNRRLSMSAVKRTMGRIWEHSGIMGLWRGNGAAMIRVVPYAGIQFSSYSYFYILICDYSLVGEGVYARLFAGSLAGITATLLTYPFDLVRARMAAHWSVQPLYHGGVFYSITHIATTEGPRALFKGLSPTLLGIVPYAGISFATFESLKSWALAHQDSFPGFMKSDAKIIKSNNNRDNQMSKLPWLQSLLLGGVAAILAQSVSYPLHVVRRRMQVEAELKHVPVNSHNGHHGPHHTPQSPPSGQTAANTFARLISIYRNEGIRHGLFKGLSLTFVKGPIGVALAFAVNDRSKSIIHNFVNELIASSEEDEDIETSDHFLHEEKKKKTINSEKAQGLSAVSGVGSEEGAGAPALKLDTVPSLIAGGIAGACAKTVIAPGDRVKILYQTSDARVRPFSLSAAWKTGVRIVHNTGYLGLWRGNGATMLRVIPYSATTYVSFDHYHLLFTNFFARNYKSDSSNTSSHSHFLSSKHGEVESRFLAGGFAACTATIVTYPLELIRARMAAHWNVMPRYSSYIGAFIEIFKTEGPRAMYRGLTPTLVGVFPYAGLNFMFFETAKAQYKQRMKLTNQNSDTPVPWYIALGMGGLSGLAAQSATYPLDIVRRRMQVHPDMYRSMFHAFSEIAANEGRAGLYKGLSMNWIKGPIAIGMSFMINDKLKYTFLNIQHQLRDQKKPGQSQATSL